MSCPAVKTLCERLVFSQAVEFDDGVLAINIPEGTYLNGEKYCIVINQPIPDETTIAGEVVITIGDEETTYPLVNANCTNVTPCEIQTRTRYSTRVHTNISTGVFKLLGKTNCSCCGCKRTGAPSLPIVTPTPTPPGP